MQTTVVVRVAHGFSIIIRQISIVVAAAVVVPEEVVDVQLVQVVPVVEAVVAAVKKN